MFDEKEEEFSRRDRQKTDVRRTTFPSKAALNERSAVSQMREQALSTAAAIGGAPGLPEKWKYRLWQLAERVGVASRAEIRRLLLSCEVLKYGFTDVDACVQHAIELLTLDGRFEYNPVLSVRGADGEGQRDITGCGRLQRYRLRSSVCGQSAAADREEACDRGEDHRTQ